ncbi:MAG: hypothetical protein H7145_00175 [Akkermansiaceae bacterium]|nr:hypothetical protein [Armatimonadota bacterium]
MTVQTDVIIERLTPNRVRVTGLGRYDMSVEAPTREAAIERFRSVAAATLKDAEVTQVTLDVPASEHPLLMFAGDMRDDPLFDAWQEEIIAYRAGRDAEIEAAEAGAK